MAGATATGSMGARWGAVCLLGWVACATGEAVDPRVTGGELHARDAGCTVPELVDASHAGADAAAAAVDAADDPFGRNCGSEEECGAGPCVDHRCSIFCDVDDAAACREVDGLCGVIRNGEHACVGALERGDDDDDLLVVPGPAILRTLAPAGDADVFRLSGPAQRWQVVVTPGAGVDLGLDFHDAAGQLIGAFDDAVAGGPESATWQSYDALGGFVVVRHTAGATGAYALTVTVLP